MRATSRYRHLGVQGNGICWHDLSIAIDLASRATFLVALPAVWVAWGTWTEVGGHTMGEDGNDERANLVIGRRRLMAVSGVIIGAGCAMVIPEHWIPIRVLVPCHGIS